MRIVHTSDWHAGRLWKTKRRLDELQAVLGSLAEFVAREAVDLVLVSGDVFDSGAPVAEAEKLVFQFLRRMGDTGATTVVIAGNHDSPARLQAWGSLAELAGVRVVARPQPADQGGVLRFRSRRGESAVVAAVPFANTRDLVSAMTLAQDDTVARQQYADGLRRMVKQLTDRFDKDAVNLLVAHTHVEGAVLSGSEREVHVGEQWAAQPQALPATAAYVALGHIHRPQEVKAAPAPTVYAGSPLQLDFGEAGEEKSFVVIDAEPKRPAKIHREPYRGARPLLKVRATLGELENRSRELRSAGWLWVTVPLESPDPDLNARVRALLPDAVKVEAELPSLPEAESTRPPDGAPPLEMFRAYFREHYGREADAELLEGFKVLLSQGEES